MASDSNAAQRDDQASGFLGFNLRKELLQALDTLGISEPTPIQQSAIPELVNGVDLIGQAQTGTGKTAAFLLPILHNLDPTRKNAQALVVAPTRELAAQIAKSAEDLSRFLKNINIATIYGGQSYGLQKRAIKSGAQVIVATPGRLIDLLDQGAIDMAQIRHIVLDEADEMLSMGFIEDIQKILAQAPADAQRALFSATVSPSIRKIAKAHLRDPVNIQAEGAKRAPSKAISQHYLTVKPAQRVLALVQCLELCQIDAAIVFVRTKQMTGDIADALMAENIRAEAINGDMPQNLREQAVSRLRNRQIDVLVATDVVARGLDVERVSHVFNLELPNNADTYIHRVGRTGRAGRSGSAISIVAPAQARAVARIAKDTGLEILEFPQPTPDAIRALRIEKLNQKLGAEQAFSPAIEGLAKSLLAQNEDAQAVICGLLKAWQGTRLDDIPSLENRGAAGKRKARDPRDPKASRVNYLPYKMPIGTAQGVTPSAIVGAMVNEGGLDPSDVGSIDLRKDHSIVELNASLPTQQLVRLSRIKLRRQPMSLVPAQPQRSGGAKPQKAKAAKKAKKTKKPVRFLANDGAKK